jgi:hypothetical protein
VKGWKGGGGCSAAVIVIGAGNGAGDSGDSGAECGGGEVAVKERPIGVAGVAGTCRG